MRNHDIRRPITIGLCILFSILAFTVAAEAQQQTVCTITINSANEKNTFKKLLPPGDFKFVELTSYNDGKSDLARSGGGWFEKACEAKVQCDILVVSGHFGGTFFGSTGFELPLDTLEENSCRSTCDGILKRPKEVFLFGCNTLAGKNRDHRTPEEYLQVLLRDRIPRAQAERIVEARYGAMGDSFRDRMRRVFPGVKHIYGFEAVGPLGSVIQPHLETYFESIIDYKAHLREQAMSTSVNEPLAQTLERFPFVETQGIQSSEPAAIHRTRICRVHDSNHSVEKRTKAVLDLLRDPDRLIYLPTVASFFRKKQVEVAADPAAQRELRAFARETETLDEIDSVASKLTSSPALRIDLHHVNYVLGRISRTEFERQTKITLSKELRRMNRESADLICSISSDYELKIKVSADDIDFAKLGTQASFAAFACLKTDDETITSYLLDRFAYASRNSEYRVSGLKAMLSLPGYGARKIQLAQATMAGGVIEGYARAVIAANSDPGGQDAEVMQIIAMSDLNQAHVFDILARAGHNEALARSILRTFGYGTDESINIRIQALVRMMPPESSVWSQFQSAMRNLPPGLSGVAAWKTAQLQSPPSAAARWAIDEAKRQPNYRVYYMDLVGKLQLSRNDRQHLFDEISRNRDSSLSGLFRWVLLRQRSLRPTEEERALLEGRRIRVSCEAPNSIVRCREIQEQ